MEDYTWVELNVRDFPSSRDRFAWLAEVDEWLAGNTKAEVHVSHRWGQGVRDSEILASYNRADAVGILDAIGRGRGVVSSGDTLRLAFRDKAEALLFKLTCGGV